MNKVYKNHSVSYIIVIVFQALQLIKSSIKYREKKFKIKSIFGEGGFKKLSISK